MNQFQKSQPIEFLAIGDIVTDAFIRLKQAEVQDSVDHQSKELCVTFGDKVPYEFVKVIKGVGNSANAAVSAARLGLNAALMSDIGGDEYGQDMIKALQDNGVGTDYISVHKDQISNYHYVLWYDVERTILVKHEKYPYALPNLQQPPQWLYLSSLGENSLEYHSKISEYLNNNPAIKLAFQPGTYQMKFGVDALKEIYARTDIFFCNKEEAQRILKSKETDIKILLKSVRALGPKVAVITDGIAGAYASDGFSDWFMPVYPHVPYERTGAGDAFASTFTSAFAMGKPLEEALSWAPINSMSVVQKIGAQEGLLFRDALEDFLKKAPADYKAQKI